LNLGFYHLSHVLPLALFASVCFSDKFSNFFPDGPRTAPPTSASWGAGIVGTHYYDWLVLFCFNVGIRTFRQWDSSGMGLS
jgi:hypothetical protein